MLQPRAISSIIHALAALDVREKELLGELARLAEARMHEFTTQVIASLRGVVLHNYRRQGAEIHNMGNRML